MSLYLLLSPLVNLKAVSVYTILSTHNLFFFMDHLVSYYWHVIL